jgi:hypothetical protein
MPAAYLGRKKTGACDDEIICIAKQKHFIAPSVFMESISRIKATFDISLKYPSSRLTLIKRCLYMLHSVLSTPS